MAVDEMGTAVWAEPGCTTVDAWRNRLGWYDPVLNDDLARLFAAWCELRADPFWDRVLTRAVRTVVVASREEMVDVACTEGWTALELLAWAVVRVQNAWVTKSSANARGGLTAPGMVRLLLAWAGIPAAVPESQSALRALAASHGLEDGPALLAWVRNRLLHPPKKEADGWPGFEELWEASCLVLEYCELALLRLLGHDGRYASRLHPHGRRQGDVSQVPWARDRPSEAEPPSGALP